MFSSSIAGSVPANGFGDFASSSKPKGSRSTSDFEANSRAFNDNPSKENFHKCLTDLQQNFQSTAVSTTKGSFRTIGKKMGFKSSKADDINTLLTQFMNEFGPSIEFNTTLGKTPANYMHNQLDQFIQSLDTNTDFQGLLLSQPNKSGGAQSLLSGLTKLREILETDIAKTSRAPEPLPRSQVTSAAQQARLGIANVYEDPSSGDIPSDDPYIMPDPAIMSSAAVENVGAPQYLEPVPGGAGLYEDPASDPRGSYYLDLGDTVGNPVTLNGIPVEGEVFPTSTKEVVDTVLSKEADFVFYQNNTKPHFAFKLGGTVHHCELLERKNNTYMLNFNGLTKTGTCEQLKDLLSNWGVNNHPFGDDARGFVESPSLQGSNHKVLRASSEPALYSIPMEGTTHKVVRASSDSGLFSMETTDANFKIPTFNKASFLPKDIALGLLDSKSSEPGHFVLRQSSTEGVTCTISMKINGSIKDFHIQHDSSNTQNPFTLKLKSGNKDFQNFDVLVDHLKQKDVSNNFGKIPDFSSFPKITKEYLKTNLSQGQFVFHKEGANQYFSVNNDGNVQTYNVTSSKAYGFRAQAITDDLYEDPVLNGHSTLQALKDSLVR